MKRVNPKYKILLKFVKKAIAKGFLWPNEYRVGKRG
jgi:hypothetical protein